VNVAPPQRDFGGFDPKFIGVTLQVDGERSWERLLRLFAGDGTDAAGLESVHDPSERAETILAATALSHELRHFHDFLLAPLGAAVVRARLMAQLNATQFILISSSSESWKAANCIPVPISDWCARSQAERSAYLAGLNSWRGMAKPPLVAPELPVVAPAEEVAEPRTRILELDSTPELLRAIARAYRQLDSYLAPPDIAISDEPFLPITASELSAILIQIQEAWMAFGQDAADLVLAELANGPPRYRRTAGIIALYEQHGLLGKPLAAAVTWSLCGGWPGADSEESAFARFAKVTAHLVRHPNDVNVDAPVGVLFADWDERFRRDPTFDTLARSLEADETFLARLEATVTALPKDFELLQPEREQALRFYRAFASGRRRCVERVMTGPDDYVLAECYLRRCVADLPKPLVAIEFRSPSAPGADDLEANGWYVHLSREERDGRRLSVVLGAPVDLPGHAFIDNETAFGALAAQSTTDVLFSPLRWDRQYWDVYLAQLLLGEDRPILRLQS
jgi:hypothetical protein